MPPSIQSLSNCTVSLQIAANSGLQHLCLAHCQLLQQDINAVVLSLAQVCTCVHLCSLHDVRVCMCVRVCVCVWGGGSERAVMNYIIVD